MNIAEIISLISAVLLIIAILIQNRGAGLGGAFGGGDGGEVFHTKRGAEKGIFILTIVLSAIFLLSAFANVVFF